jgi:hypothetical protein
MMKYVKTAALAVVFAAAPSHASLMTVTFDNGDSLADWTVDRAAPAGFEIINNGLVMSIDGQTLDTDPFRNTQGRKLDIAGSDFVSIDMFIDSAWTGSERFAGIWGVGVDDANVIRNYPILEFADEDLAAYDSGIPGFASVAATFTVGAFNTLALQAVNNGVEYFVNGGLVYSETTSGTTSFSEVILNAKNDGNSFSVRYDNLVFGTVGTAEVPVPATLGLFGLGLTALGWKRRKNA